MPAGELPAVAAASYHHQTSPPPAQPAVFWKPDRPDLADSFCSKLVADLFAAICYYPSNT
jgi:hypothetical protein